MTLLCLFAHHRCASSWSNDILRGIARAAGWNHRVVHDERDFGHDLQAFCVRESTDILTFSNARTEYLGRLPACLGMHLVRDPRDVLVSSYFAHRNSHPTGRWPELEDHRLELQSLSLEEGLILELDCRESQFNDMAEWDYGRNNVLEYRFVTMVHCAPDHFTHVIRQWGRLGTGDKPSLERTRRAYNLAVSQLARLSAHPALPPWRASRVSQELVAAVVERNSFTRKSGGRPRGDADDRHHYRSGTAGSWRDYFFPELRRRFKRRYGGLLIKLGYERTNDW